MRPPVRILKFLAIEGAENRDAEGVEGEEKPTRTSIVSSPSGVEPQQKTSSAVLYLELEKTHLIVYQVYFLIYFVYIKIISVKL